ncbi:MAG: hypothetical protein AAGG75_06605 [Bacteroidota bacterium]
MRCFTLVCVLCLCYSSCTEKETILQKDHTNVIVDDNTAPPYEQVTTVQIQNYINKAFIDLLGTEPSPEELNAYTADLRAGELSTTVREVFLNDLTSSADYFQIYYQRLDEIYFGAYLAGTPKSDILDQRNIFNDIYEDYMQAGEVTLAALLKVEIDKLDLLLRAFIDYAQGTIDVNNYMRRICDNGIYEEINMGSENFVLSCFENFLKRLPTDVELAAGVTMVDGFSSRMLLQDGSSRSDFLDILLNSPGFYEGLTTDIYSQLLARKPSSEEMGEATLRLTDDRDYQALQRRVMSSKEYAGF